MSALRGAGSDLQVAPRERAHSNNLASGPLAVSISGEDIYHPLLSIDVSISAGGVLRGGSE